MDDLTRSLRLLLTYGRNPASWQGGGEVEHWRVCVYEVRLRGIKYPFELTGNLEWIDVPERGYLREDLGDDAKSELDLARYWSAIKGIPASWAIVPAHREYLPGVRVTTKSFPSLHSAKVRARELALCLSGYMLPGPWLIEREFSWEEGKKQKQDGPPPEEPPKNITPELSQTLRQLGLRYE